MVLFHGGYCNFGSFVAVSGLKDMVVMVVGGVWSAME